MNSSLDKCIWLHFPQAERAHEERYGSSAAAQGPSVLTAYLSSHHRPVPQEPINFSYLIGHRAERDLDQRNHMTFPSESSACTVTHTLKRSAGSFCGTGVQQLWHWVPKPLTAFRDPLWLHCFTTANHRARWHHEAPWSGFFCKASFCPKQLFLLQNSCMPANLGAWNRAVPPGGTTAWGNAWFSNGDAALLN